MTQGTGKYKDYVGVKLTGGFIGQTSKGIYHMNLSNPIRVICQRPAEFVVFS